MGSKKTTKNAKGTVSLENDKNKIRLRWRYQSKRYTLNLFSFNQHNLLQAKKIAVTIENDLVTGSFDTTLTKYRIGSTVKSAPEAKSIIALFEYWSINYRNRDCEKHKNYNAIRNMMRRWEPFQASDILKHLNKQQINERTYNRRLTLLKSFVTWLVKSNIVTNNYLEDVQAKKVIKKINSKRKPFSQSEIVRILEAIKNDSFSPISSSFKHSHYYAFLFFLFKTGVRNAEAIGLRVKNIHYDTRVIEIGDVLARSINCSNASKRIRKETKNGKVRLLPLSDDMYDLLQNQTDGKDGEALVFHSPKGLAIDDKMFQRRIFKKVLKELNIEERVLYACRHTFGSRCIENGLSPVTTAFLMGNNPETALKIYTHQLSRPSDLPSLKF